MALLLAAAVALPATSSAEAPLLTLGQAIEIALVHSHRLGAADASIGEAEARVDEARSGRLPRVGLDAGYSRTDSPTRVFSYKLDQGVFAADDFDVSRLNDPDPLSDVRGVASVYQPIYSGGAIRSGIDAAAAERDAATALRERSRQEVVEHVIVAYTDAVLTRHQLDVARESFETARANVRLVADLRDAGLVVESDLLQARVRETEVLELVAASESAVELARAEVNLALGRDLGTAFVAGESLDAPPPADDGLDQLIAAALETRPDLRAGRERLRSSEQSVRSAMADQRPTLGVTGVAQAHSDEPFGSYGSDWAVSVDARFTVFDGNRASARVRQAAERLRRAQSEHELLRQTIDLEVRRGFHDRLTARKRLVQTEAAIGMAQESLRIVRDRYREGLTTLVELLDAESRLTGARTRDVAARRELLLAQARLDLAIGIL